MSPPELSGDYRLREELCDVGRAVLGRVRSMVAVVLGLGLGVALVACAPAGPPRTATSRTPTASVEPTAVTEPYEVGKVEPPDGAAYTGVFRPPAPYEIGSLDGYDEFTDKPPALLMWFQPWDEAGANEFDPALVVSTLAARRGPAHYVGTMESWRRPKLPQEPEKQPDYQLRDILDGTYDDYIRSWARGIKSVNGPVMLRPMHEMNGSLVSVVRVGSTATSPASFAMPGATYTTYSTKRASTTSHGSGRSTQEVPPTPPENEYCAYYPGDEYVDWASISGFNWGTSRTVCDGESSRSSTPRPSRTSGRLASRSCCRSLGAFPTAETSRVDRRLYERIRHGASRDRRGRLLRQVREGLEADPEVADR